jgi:selenide,water dikinase
MAIKARLATAAQELAANRSMAALNQEAARLALAHGVRAATDVTGFGLLGHALQLARASGAALELWAGALPRLDGVRGFAELGLLSAAAYSNRAYVGSDVAFGEHLALADQDLCFDPQTSGGLLLACPAGRAQALVEALGGPAAGAALVGRVLPEDDGPRLRVLTAPPSP